MKRKYIRKNLFFYVILLTQMIASCTKMDFSEYEDTGADKKTSDVKIITRGANGDELTYPLHVYAFAESGALQTQQTLNTPDEDIRLSLPTKENYRIVVLSADEDAYDIPASPTLSSVITMKEPLVDDDIPEFIQSIVHGYTIDNALQMGHADIIPSDTKTSITIQLYYQVASLNVTLNNLPSVCNAAYITISEIASGIQMNGKGGSAQTARIPLRKNNDNSFTSGETFLFPGSSDKTKLTLTYNDEKGEQNASATMSALRAGTPYNLTGTYTDGSLSFSGSVSPSQWAEAVNIDFTFHNGENIVIPEGDEPEGGDDDPEDVDDIPTAPCLWNNHIVVDVQVASDKQTATLLLVSLAEWSGLTSALNEANPTKAFSYASQYEEFGLGGWSIPTTDEAKILYRQYNNNVDVFEDLYDAADADEFVLSDAKDDKVRYLCAEATKTYSFYNSTIYKAGTAKNTYHLRLVRSVQIQVKQ